MPRKIFIFSFLIAIVGLNPVMADYDSHFKIEIPDSVSAIVTSSEMRDFINSDSPLDRIVACQRLGQIKGKSAYRLLVETFNNESGRPVIEAPRGVKYYALLNIANTGVPDAENYLKTISTQLAEQVETIPRGFVSVDIMDAIAGSFDGLLELDTNSAIDYLKRVFDNEKYYWMIRQMAHMNTLRNELKKGVYATASDTTEFLLNLITQSGSKITMYDSTGSINVNFILNGSSGYLLFEYGRTTLPHLRDYILNLDPDDPMLPALRQLETDMTSNPPR